MLKNEERLFDEYKRVDNICRDIFSSQSGVTQYITEMEQRASYGRSVIPSWNDDYYTLKRVRWLRNKIAHDSGETECNENDAAWLENFHRRLLNGQDPLALLSKAYRRRSSSAARCESRPMVVSEQYAGRSTHLRKKKSSSSLKNAVAAVIAAGTALIVLFIVAGLFKIVM